MIYKDEWVAKDKVDGVCGNHKEMRQHSGNNSKMDTWELSGNHSGHVV
jgi:hypothetical protein